VVVAVLILAGLFFCFKWFNKCGGVSTSWAKKRATKRLLKQILARAHYETGPGNDDEEELMQMSHVDALGACACAAALYMLAAASPKAGAMSSVAPPPRCFAQPRTGRACSWLRHQPPLGAGGGRCLRRVVFALAAAALAACH